MNAGAEEATYRMKVPALQNLPEGNVHTVALWLDTEASSVATGFVTISMGDKQSGKVPSGDRYIHLNFPIVHANPTSLEEWLKQTIPVVYKWAEGLFYEHYTKKLCLMYYKDPNPTSLSQDLQNVLHAHVMEAIHGDCTAPLLQTALNMLSGGTVFAHHVFPRGHPARLDVDSQKAYAQNMFKLAHAYWSGIDSHGGKCIMCRGGKDDKTPHKNLYYIDPRDVCNAKIPRSTPEELREKFQRAMEYKDLGEGVYGDSSFTSTSMFGECLEFEDECDTGIGLYNDTLGQPSTNLDALIKMFRMNGCICTGMKPKIRNHSHRLWILLFDKRDNRRPALLRMGEGMDRALKRHINNFMSYLGIHLLGEGRLEVLEQMPFMSFLESMYLNYMKEPDMTHFKPRLTVNQLQYVIEQTKSGYEKRILGPGSLYPEGSTEDKMHQRSLDMYVTRVQGLVFDDNGAILLSPCSDDSKKTDTLRFSHHFNSNLRGEHDSGGALIKGVTACPSCYERIDDRGLVPHTRLCHGKVVLLKGMNGRGSWWPFTGVGSGKENEGGGKEGTAEDWKGHAFPGDTEMEEVRD
jgi:hypothetical protein